MYADSHCHLSFPQFDDDRPEVVRRLREAGVELLIDPGIDVGTSRRSIALARQYDFIYANVGLHPHDASAPLPTETYTELEELARSPEVTAIGEIGLDYHYDEIDPAAQQAAFREMLRMARRLDLPVVIHTRDAWQETLRILSEEAHSGLRGVMHCFSGDVEIAEECVRRGFMLSIPGIVTYKRSTLPEVVAAIGIEHLLTETDAPYLAPVPYRGKRNEPAHVRLVADAVADIKGMGRREAAERLFENTRRAFEIG